MSKCSSTDSPANPVTDDRMTGRGEPTINPDDEGLYYPEERDFSRPPPGTASWAFRGSARVRRKSAPRLRASTVHDARDNAEALLPVDPPPSFALRLGHDRLRARSGPSVQSSAMQVFVAARQ